MANEAKRSKRRTRDSALKTMNALTTYAGWGAKEAARSVDIPEGSSGRYIQKCREAKDAVEFAEACKAVDRQLMVGTYEVAFKLQEKLLELVAKGLLEDREVGWNLDKALMALSKMRMWDQGTLLENGQGDRLEAILDRVMKETPEGSSFKLEVTKAQPAIDVTVTNG